MKFLVLSDTHGKTGRAVKIYNTLEGIDAIIHLGDYEKDARLLETELGCDVISVRGNMDGGYTKEEYKVLDTECGRILLTHGHMQNVKGSLQTLLYFAEEHECRIVLFGHTHRALNADAEGIWLLNPGSLTLPADGSSGTCAVLEITGNYFNTEIIEWNKDLEETMPCQQEKASENRTAPAKAKPKVQGGFIRDLLNNSDRF